MKGPICNVLTQLGQKAAVADGLDELSRLLDQQSFALVVLALSDTGDLQGVTDFIRLLRTEQPFAQSILVVPAPLTLTQSCQVVVAGVCSIVNGAAENYLETLAAKASEALNYAFEQYGRHKQVEEKDLTEQGLVGQSTALAHVVSQARRAAAVSDAPVIIFGESGTGKQRFAEAIHHWDRKRGSKPFISVNCAAISGSLAESELFGHCKGAFTGATESRPGYFRSADGGTILLDEVSELDLPLQPKILRVLQEGLVLPVGSDREYRIDVRIIAASNRDLQSMVEQGKFRLDLFQRLNVIQLDVPSLRQRSGDIPLLFDFFLKKYAHYSSVRIDGVEPAVYELLGRTIGSGNVRELENIVRQILVFKEQSGPIEISDLPPAIIQSQLQAGAEGSAIEISDQFIESLFEGRKHLNDVLDHCEKVVLERLVARGLNRTTLAERLGVTRRTLYNKLEKYNIH